ncbi:MAG: hypothetical protein R3D80_21195 [Paracoccaceae bacterium]
MYVLAARALRHLVDEVREKPLCALPADLRRLGNGRPGTLHAHHQAATRGFAHREVAAAAVHVAPVLGHAPDECLDQIGAHFAVTAIAQRLAGLHEVERHRRTVVRIRRNFLHQGDQVGFKACGLIEPRLRTVFHADVDEDRDVGVVVGYPERFKISQRLRSAWLLSPLAPASSSVDMPSLAGAFG